MDQDVRIAYTLGLLDSTVGSPRLYSTEDYRRRMKMVAASLRDDQNLLKELGKEDLKRQDLLDNDEKESRIARVREAIDSIYKLYGFQGESGTEELLHLLDNAVIETIKEANRSHDEDACFTDCVSVLARMLDAEVVSAKVTA
jgi:hypothetical protein